VPEPGPLAGITAVPVRQRPPVGFPSGAVLGPASALGERTDVLADIELVAGHATEREDEDVRAAG